MYTRCTECETLFRVTRAQLNAARGQVRCGRCGTVFDALASLREEFTVDEPQPEDAPQLESIAEAEPEPASTTSARTKFEIAEDDTDPSDEEVSAAVEAALGAPPALIPPPRPRRRVWPWALAAVFLTLTLAAQAVHLERERLAQHPVAGPWISKAYDRLGLRLPADPRFDLTAFQLLHHELVSHPRTSGALHLSAVLSNEAGFAQPWPTLELRLQDRFGEIVAARRLQPKEYLRNPPQDGEPMPPKARRAIEIAFVDPGHDAVGFSIDFCVNLRDGLHCSK